VREGREGGREGRKGGREGGREGREGGKEEREEGGRDREIGATEGGRKPLGGCDPSDFSIRRVSLLRQTNQATCGDCTCYPSHSEVEAGGPLEPMNLRRHLESKLKGIGVWLSGRELA
jgi:hypothetical protein